MPVTSADCNSDLDGLFAQLALLAEDSRPLEAKPCRTQADDESLRLAPTREDELSAAPETAAGATLEEAFFPAAPRSLTDTNVVNAEIEDIVLRLLMHRGTMAGMEISQHIGLPFAVTEKLLYALKAQRLLVFKCAAALSDYVYEITDLGLQYARQSAVDCSYCGTVPVSLNDYCASVAAQSLGRTKPRIESLRRAFADLVISPQMFARLGRAISSGYGLFLHGPPGNGKTSIAERITAAYGTCIWIPRAISVWGEIVRVFDPSCHEELPLAAGEQIVAAEKIDHRWVRIRRPTIVVGGELTMESLEVTMHKDTGIGEAPLQMKSNGGTLVIDDFGRQRISPQKLLNRWIVPLETRRDYLGLASGRKICVPFDQFIVFSTNLEPRELVDEAFLRRLPYKIEVQGPTVEEFRGLFQQICQKQKIAYDSAALDHLITTHYESVKRPMRFCQARDLLHQVGVYCRFHRLPLAMTRAALDVAAADYFSVMGR